MKIESNQLPSSIIQKYLDSGYTYEQIANFSCSVRETKDGDVFTVTSPKSKQKWKRANNQWEKA